MFSYRVNTDVDLRLLEARDAAGLFRLVDVALARYGLNRVEIRVATGNHKSRAIPERLGFRNEGCRRQAEWLYDHFVDHMIYGCLSHEWHAPAPQDVA